MKRDLSIEKKIPYWRCKCDCGNEKTLSKTNLLKTKNCGCNKDHRKTRKVSLIGQRFGRLVVISEENKKNGIYRICKCDCGKIVSTKTVGLNRKNSTNSCGCFQKEKTGNASRIHGYSKKGFSIEYSSWLNMRQGCYLKSHNRYEKYGSRGIKVCDRWLSSFEFFLEDMGSVPSKKHSLDRIDVNGDYCKENCRWASQYVQQGNRSNNVWHEINGVKLIQSDWARYMNIHENTIRKKIKKGVSFEDIYYFYLNKGVFVENNEKLSNYVYKRCL